MGEDLSPQLVSCPEDGTDPHPVVPGATSVAGDSWPGVLPCTVTSTNSTTPGLREPWTSLVVCSSVSSLYRPQQTSVCVLVTPAPTEAWSLGAGRCLRWFSFRHWGTEGKGPAQDPPARLDEIGQSCSISPAPHRPPRTGKGSTGSLASSHPEFIWSQPLLLMWSAPCSL